MDSRVRTTVITEGKVDDVRGIQDMGVGTKRKEDVRRGVRGVLRP